MKKVGFFVGIDSFLEGDSLVGAANDARQLSNTFARAGFETTYLSDEEFKKRTVYLIPEVKKEMAHLAAGDLLVFFYAGHGRTVSQPRANKPDHKEQVFLLPHASLSALNEDHIADGVFTIGALESATRIDGLRRLFLFDACRPLGHGKRGESASPAFDGEVSYRNLRLSKSSAVSQLTTVNSCRDGQLAAELKSQRRGLFSSALDETMKERLGTGGSIVLDRSFIDTVAQRMRALSAQLHGDPAARAQEPYLDGEPVCLFEPDARQQQRLSELQAQFEEQLSAGRLEHPPDDCARDTLSGLRAIGRLLEAGAEEAWMQAGRQRLADALAAQQQEERRRDDDAYAEAVAANTIAAIEEYLRAFPSGAHQAQAEQLLAELRAAAEVRKRDDAAFAQAEQSGTADAYRRYLEEFPAGKRADEAALRIGRIETGAAKAAAAQPTAAAAPASKPDVVVDRWPLGKWWTVAVSGLLVVFIVSVAIIPGRKPDPNESATAAATPQTAVPSSPSAPAVVAPDPADVQAYLRTREAIVGSTWWSAPFKGAAPTGYQDWLTRGARLAKAGYPAALFDQGWALAFGRGLASDPVAAVDHFLRWIALPREAVGDPTGAERNLAVSALTETLVAALRAGPAVHDWSPVVARLNTEPRPDYPADLWRGLLAECTLAGGGMDEARRAYRRLADAAAAVADGNRDFALTRLKALGQACR